jgi:hypothetical protein
MTSRQPHETDNTVDIQNSFHYTHDSLNDISLRTLMSQCSYTTDSIQGAGHSIGENPITARGRERVRGMEWLAVNPVEIKALNNQMPERKVSAGV